MRSPDLHETSAFSVMALDIVSTAVSRGDQPAQLARYFCQEIRKLTGAKCVVLVVPDANEAAATVPQVLAISPQRRARWAGSAEARSLYEPWLRQPTELVWPRGDPAPAAEFFRQEGFALALALPLQAGVHAVGMLLVLGLPDKRPVAMLLSLLRPLAPLVALVLRTALASERQEALSGARAMALCALNARLEIEQAERRRIERALRISEEKFAKVFRLNPDAMYLTRMRDGVFLEVNHGFTRLTGYSAEEAVGRTALPEGLNIWLSAQEREDCLRQLRATGEVIDYEARQRRKNGEVGRALMSVRRVEIDGEPCLLGVSRDMTEAHRVGEILRTIATNTARTLGADYFNTIVRQLAETFEVRYALVGVLTEARDRVQVLACWARDRLVTLPEYELAGSPCADVANSDLCCVPQGVQARYPEDTMLVQYGVEGYCGTPMLDITGRPLGVLVMMDDKPVISPDERTRALLKIVAARAAVEVERLRAEQAWQAALEEKTALLKEVHHRVKNNLQIVISLLNLQTGQTDNAAAQATLRDTQNRVRSMALLHEALYRCDNLARINFPAYVESLCAHLFRSFGLAAGRLQLSLQVAEVALNLDQAVPCGLIVNELVSNAIKHAFPEGRAGRITVELTADADRRIALQVTDDGIGFAPPSEDAIARTLGLQLVINLARQLGGAAEFLPAPHAGCRVVFIAQKSSGSTAHPFSSP
ncbi:MAG: PAS domain S-box protein [Opitutae bacterium]|nr:PAS domain S-box protein [Opitutae bacterium]